jgi:sensor histidine kinase YesM
VSLLSTIGLSLWSLGEYRRIHLTIQTGSDLIADARRVHVLMKDLLVGVFTPMTYGLLKDLVHLESFSSTRRFWAEEAASFQNAFRRFMQLPRLRRMVAQDPHLESQYQVAIRLGEEAFSMVHSLQARLAELDQRGILGTEDLYQQIQRSNEPAMIGVFNEVRETSFFLANTFESFLHHFIRSLQEQAVVLQRRVATSFLVVAASMTVLGLLLPYAIAGRIIASVDRIAHALRDVARGDFSVTLSLNGADEFGSLSRDFNSFVHDLRGNVEAMVGLQRRLQEIAVHEADVGAVLQVVTDTLVSQAAAEWAAVVAENGSGAVLSHTGALPADVVHGAEAGAFSHRQIVPFEIPQRLHAHLVVGRDQRGEPFNDLQRTVVHAYAEFAALVVENHYSYAELLERRNAQFQALEAQIRPHFLYNVLGSFMGLNRMGDRERLESSILALKDLLRHSLDGSHFVSLGDEFRIAERYCELQRLRFDQRLSYEVRLPPGVANLRVPGLLVQPLIENAIIHGIEPLDRPGHVSLRAESDPQQVRIIVEDDGIGFIPSPIARSTHIGLFNVRERLRLAYSGADLSVDSAPGEGARCTISIPITEVSRCVS